MPNRLAAETSPYLLQHQDNPVDWYPWGPEAFGEAVASDRPILLSVGYSSCHWCHVMAHESFEDDDTAEVMNRLFVNVKVDREERPDVDGIYMDAVQAMTGRGGWPMTVFLTPDGEPFYAGTYFPKDDRHGMPSFQRVMGAVHDAWTNRRDEVVTQAGKLTAAVGRSLPMADELPGTDALEQAYLHLRRTFDTVQGGFGGAPKFPQEPVLEFLLRAAGSEWAPDAHSMLELSLEKMARGGIYDHLGGGFARYTVDGVWLVPHFEKMLYNNAELARLYLRAWQLTGNKRFRRITTETIDYVLRDLTNDQGGFMSAEDADSEGVEGKFYVFTLDELAAAVGPEDAPAAAAYFGVTAAGNFEGSNVLHEAMTVEEVAARLEQPVGAVAAAIDRAKAALLAARAPRVRPGLDDKVVTAWNGLMLRAVAEAGAVLGRPDYLDAARRNARFVLDQLRRDDGRVVRSWSKGRAEVPGYLDDYAAYAVGLSVLYEATGEVEWFEAARELTEEIPRLFADDDGSLFRTGADAESLIVRPRDQMDNPSPSGSSLAAEAFLRLGLYTGDDRWSRRFEEAMRASGRIIEAAPAAAGHLLAVLTSYRAGMREVAVVGADAEALAATVWSSYRPNLVLAVDAGGTNGTFVPLLADRARVDETLAYVCEQMTCLAPVTTAEALTAALDA